MRENPHNVCYRTVETSVTMSTDTNDIPTMQWIYNRIFLLAVASLVFFFVVYLGWGLLDIISVPAR